MVCHFASISGHLFEFLLTFNHCGPFCVIAQGKGTEKLVERKRERIWNKKKKVNETLQKQNWL